MYPREQYLNKIISKKDKGIILTHGRMKMGSSILE